MSIWQFCAPTIFHAVKVLASPYNCSPYVRNFPLSLSAGLLCKLLIETRPLAQCCWSLRHFSWHTEEQYWENSLFSQHDELKDSSWSLKKCNLILHFWNNHWIPYQIFLLMLNISTYNTPVKVSSKWKTVLHFTFFRTKGWYCEIFSHWHEVLLFSRITERKSHEVYWQWNKSLKLLTLLFEYHAN